MTTVRIWSELQSSYTKEKKDFFLCLPKWYVEDQAPFKWMQERLRYVREGTQRSGMDAEWASLQHLQEVGGGCFTILACVGKKKPSRSIQTGFPVSELLCSSFWHTMKSMHQSLSSGSLWLWDLTLSCPFLCVGDISTLVSKALTIHSSYSPTHRRNYQTIVSPWHVRGRRWFSKPLSTTSLCQGFCSWNPVPETGCSSNNSNTGILPAKLAMPGHTNCSPRGQLTVRCFWNRINNTCY